ncbi:MAG: autotransporter protein [Ilumatobacteraceae bacterium]|nr:autotransporter protein [Ilumatobacteraceae bacterium]
MSAPTRADRGFTLVELLIAIVLSGIIGGVTVAAMSTSLNVASSTSAEVADTTDAALISSFLFRDAQAAAASVASGGGGGSGAASGVSTASTTHDWSGCTQSGAFVARFSWLDVDTAGDQRPIVASYALDASHQLIRRLCRDATTSDLVLGHSVTAADASCSPDAQCAGAAGSVSLHVHGSGVQAPFDYTLTASLRVDAHNTATSQNSAPVPLVALGDPGSSRPCPNLTVSGSGSDHVLGAAVVGSDCGASPISGDPAQLHASGGVTTTSGVGDPFAGIAAPSEACTGSTNPSPVGDNPTHATVVYPLAVTVTGAVQFEAGTYIFCNGLTFGVGATVVGSDVLLVVAGGTFTTTEQSTVHLAAARTGSHANLVVWVTTAQHVVIDDGPIANTLDGYLYAPTSQIDLEGIGALNLGGVVAQGVAFSGSTDVRIGLPVPPVVVTSTALPRGQVGVAYAPTTISATGGSAPYRWRAGGLPAGMSIDPASGVITGSPQSAGSFDVVITAYDVSASASSLELALTVDPALKVTGPATLPAGEVAVAYPSTVATTSGGAAPFAWTATGLPGGLVIDPASGVISGTPTASGAFSVTVSVTDSSGASASKTLSLTVAPILAITTASLPGGQVGVAYASTTMQSSGGTPAYVWSATGLPAGLSMNASGVLSGTPTAAGSATVVVKVVDGLAATATRSYTVTIAAALGVGTASLPTGEVSIAYSPTTLTTSGGTAPFVWSATGLPPGLTLNPSSAVLSGTPTVAGTSTVNVTVVDATGTSSSATYSLTVVARLTVTGPATLPAGTVGTTYPSTPMTSSGGGFPLTWSASGLPAGLSIASSTGVISGTPTTPGTSTPTITATDALGATGSKSYTVQVVAALSITTASVPATQLGAPYSTTIAATGGNPAYTWSATGLPAGLTMSSAGVISGTPTASGTFTVVAKVVDSTSSTATRSYSLVVSSVPYGCPSNPSGWRAEYFANVSLTGTAPVCRDDAAINFDWGSGSPAAGIPVDNFSARWTRTQAFAAGSYIFTMGSDDGSRLYIDGVKVFDQWTDHGYPSPVPTYTTTLTAGNHDIVMEFYERGGGASATLSWAVDAPVTCPSSPSGWVGQYYNNKTLTGSPVMCRDDASINFNWANGSPNSTVMGVDNFSVRWTRTTTFTAGTYTFTLGSDDGARLYIDGTLVLNKWNDQSYPSPQPSVNRTLTAGAHTIVVEYYENSGSAQATLVQTP